MTLVIVAVGLLWGACPLVFVTPAENLEGLLQWTSLRPVSALADLCRADNVVPWIVLMFMPRAVSTDVLIWTVGLGLWLAHRQGWAGSALAAFLSQRTVVGEIVLTVSDLLAGVALSFGVVAFARLCMRIMEPRH